LVVSIHLLDLDGLVGHMLSEVVILEINVACARPELRNISQLNAAGVVLKYDATEKRDCR
jgi:hypothetical protein